MSGRYNIFDTLKNGSPLNNLLLRELMKLCYCDESGTGNEPVAVMVGIVVDTKRMHLTKYVRITNVVGQ